MGKVSFIPSSQQYPCIASERKGHKIYDIIYSWNTHQQENFLSPKGGLFRRYVNKFFFANHQIQITSLGRKNQEPNSNKRIAIKELKGQDRQLNYFFCISVTKSQTIILGQNAHKIQEKQIGEDISQLKIFLRPLLESMHSCIQVLKQ